MSRYILFFFEKTGAYGHNYTPNVKYKIKKEDGKFVYADNDKIDKRTLHSSEFRIGEIINSNS